MTKRKPFTPNPNYARLATMQVGESFDVPADRAHAFRNAAYRHKQKTGAAFTILRIKKGEYRCLRAA